MTDIRHDIDFKYKIIKAEKIVIIGAGPFALIQAILLKNKNKEIDVTIVGPQLGNEKNYTRSGDVLRNVVNNVNSLITPEEIQQTSGRHLKDIERQLYQIASKLNITFVPKKFSKFINDKKIEVIDENNQTSELPADLIYDCSGTNKVCIKEINKIRPYTFLFESLPHDTRESYALVRVVMSRKEYEIFNR